MVTCIVIHKSIHLHASLSSYLGIVQYIMYLTVLFTVFELIITLMLQLCLESVMYVLMKSIRLKRKGKCWISWTGE
jgi:hypothetical protein